MPSSVSSTIINLHQKNMRGITLNFTSASMLQTGCRHLEDPLHHDIAQSFSWPRNSPYAYTLRVMDKKKKLGRGDSKYQYAGIKALYIPDVKSATYGVVRVLTSVRIQTQSAPRDSWKAGCSSNTSLRASTPT